MKRCFRCNKLLADTAKFCTTCGAVCDDAVKPPADAPNAPSASKAARERGVPAGKAASHEAEPAPKPRKRKPRRKHARRAAILLLSALIVIAAAVIVVATGRRKRAGTSPMPAAALVNTQIESEAAPVLPDDSRTRIETPELTGMALDDAVARLAEMGLVADVYEAGYQPEHPDGYVFAQDVEAGTQLVKGDHVALSVNVVPLTLEVLQTSVRSGRITLGNVVEVCRAMGTSNPNFDFSIVVHAAEDYELKGGFRCLVGAGEETPVSRVNTQFLRDGTLVNGLSSNVAYKDAIVWTFALEDWMGFHFENVTGYDVSLSSRVEPGSAVKKNFSPERTKSMALVDCPTNHGRVRIDVPTTDALAIRITDDQLPAGYSNSPLGTGDGVPKWEVKLVIGSYKWISANVDGSGGEPQADMQVTGLQFPQKGAKPTPFPGVSYTVNGEVMVVSVPLPKDMDFDPYAISYIELRFDDGAYSEKIKIQ